MVLNLVPRTVRRRMVIYQGIIFVLTFACYAFFHATRKGFSNSQVSFGRGMRLVLWLSLVFGQEDGALSRARAPFPSAAPSPFHFSAVGDATVLVSELQRIDGAP